MTLTDALDLDPPKTGYRIQGAVGTDGDVWWVARRTGSGAAYAHRFVRRHWGWGTEPEYVPPDDARLLEVDWAPGWHEPPESYQAQA